MISEPVTSERNAPGPTLVASWKAVPQVRLAYLSYQVGSYHHSWIRQVHPLPLPLSVKLVLLAGAALSACPPLSTYEHKSQLIGRLKERQKKQCPSQK